MATTSSSTKAPQFDGDVARPRWSYKQWMIAQNPALFFDELVNEFGDFIHYRGLVNLYLVNHPSLVKQVLQQTHAEFDKNSVIYDRFRNAFGDGLVVAEGKRWRRQRKLMQPMFGHSAVARFFDLMVSSTRQLLDRWEARFRSNEVFDVAEEMNDVTLQIAGRSLFHDAFTEASDDIQKWTHVINRYSAIPPLPILGRLWFPTPMNLKLKAALRDFHSFLQDMIDERRAEEDGRDLLGILLRSRHEESGDLMTDQEIAEEVLGMIIGGHETSSSALTWIWYELDSNPEIRERLTEEIKHVLGDEPISMEHVANLRYTKMVIDESLRLHPPFWFENRNAATDVELGGITIPQGSMVAFSRYSVHRHRQFWNDPDRFDPERFAPGKESNTRQSYATVPFGGGPRICIGINFAIMELLVIVAMVTQKFRLQVDDSNRHKMTANLTMNPKHGVRVKLQRIN